MTRSTNYSELRKMSNPIPINTWQMRSQRKIDDSIQYDPGIMDHCTTNSSISPHSTFSVSPSPSHSFSPFKDLKKQQQLNQQQYQQQQIDQFNQILNENHNYNTNNTNTNQYDSELESLFVNTTLSDVTLASNIQNTDDNSNSSAKLAATLNNDDLCDIEMTFGNSNQHKKTDLYTTLDYHHHHHHQQQQHHHQQQQQSYSHDTNSDPVLTQITLNSPLYANQANLNSNNNNNNSNKNHNTSSTNVNNFLLKRHLFDSVNNNSSNNAGHSLLNSQNNTNTNDDMYLPSINVSNLTNNNNNNNNNNLNSNSNLFSSSNVHNTENVSAKKQFVPSKSSFLTTQQTTTTNTATPVNIFRFNPNDLFNNQYSMSLPSNYNNILEFTSQQLLQTQPSAISESTVSNNDNQSGQIDLDNCQMDDSDDLTDTNEALMSTTTTTTTSVPSSSSNFTNLSTSLPAYTIDDYMNKCKTQNMQMLDQSAYNVQSIHHNRKMLNPLNRLTNVSMACNTHLSKLLNNNKVFNAFNSDSNLSCANTTISSVPSISSPLSSLQDDFEGINNNKANFLGSGTTIAAQEDDYDEDQDSDDESINNEMLLDLMNKNRDTFFWQYNIQSKGPKTKKVLTLRNKDPHLHRDFFDPVYQLQTISSRGTSLNKLRKGDGNDVTPNSEKLYNLGLQIRDFIQKSYQMNSLNNNGMDVITNEKMNLKREKNKIASRACRLKKKAQHEANKLKLYGLNQEHKQLVEAIHMAKNLIKERLHNPEATANKSLIEILDDVCNKKLTTKVAGNADSYVYVLMQNIEKERNNYLNPLNVNSMKQSLFQNDENMFNVFGKDSPSDKDEKHDDNNNNL